MILCEYLFGVRASQHYNSFCFSSSPQIYRSWQRPNRSQDSGSLRIRFGSIHLCDYLLSWGAPYFGGCLHFGIGREQLWIGCGAEVLQECPASNCQSWLCCVVLCTCFAARGGCRLDRMRTWYYKCVEGLHSEYSCARTYNSPGFVHHTLILTETDSRREWLSEWLELWVIHSFLLRFRK